MSKKIKTQKKRRVCKATGCKNILSVYNPDAHCYVHQQIAMAMPELYTIKRRYA